MVGASREAGKVTGRRGGDGAGGACRRYARGRARRRTGRRRTGASSVEGSPRGGAGWKLQTALRCGTVATCPLERGRREEAEIVGGYGKDAATRK